MRPAALAHVLVGLRQLASHRQNQGHRQVGHVIGQHAGGVRHRHTLTNGGRHVNAVIAHAKHRQHLELRQLRDQAARHHGFTAGGQTHDLGRQRRHGLCIVGLVSVHLVDGFQCRYVQRVYFGHGQNFGLTHLKSSFEWQQQAAGLVCCPTAFGQRYPEWLEKIKRQQKSNLFMWHREIINRQPN